VRFAVLVCVLALAAAFLARRLRARIARRVVRAAAVAVALPSGAYAGVRAYANLRPPPDPSPPRVIAEGIVYARRVEPTVPRVEHWAKIDLTAPGRAILVTDGDDDPMPLRGKTTSDFAAETRAVVAINGGFFEPWEPGLFDPYPGEGERVAPLGLAASRGHVYGTVDARVRTLFIAEDGGRVSFERPATIYSAISGGCMLVERGAPTPDCALRKLNDQRHPRTAVGLSADRETMWLLVVDGRQARYSKGATLAELADLFVAEGAADALNLDGGGSSVMVIDGEIVSTPISGGVPGHERVVGSHIGVR
jgi:hypothetical protein